MALNSLLSPLPLACPQGSNAEFKNELLFSQFGINYNTLPEQFKKAGVWGQPRWVSLTPRQDLIRGRPWHRKQAQAQAQGEGRF